MAIKVNIAASRQYISRQHLKRCRLSSAIHTQQTKTLALRHTEAQPVNCQVSPELLGLVDFGDILQAEEIMSATATEDATSLSSHIHIFIGDRCF